MTIQEITGKHYNKFIVWYQTNYQGTTIPSLKEFDRLPNAFKLGVLGEFTEHIDPERDFIADIDDIINDAKDYFEQID